jgi:hypothetical protein
MYLNPTVNLQAATELVEFLLKNKSQKTVG